VFAQRPTFARAVAAHQGECLAERGARAVELARAQQRVAPPELRAPESGTVAGARERVAQRVQDRTRLGEAAFQPQAVGRVERGVEARPRVRRVIGARGQQDERADAAKPSGVQRRPRTSGVSADDAMGCRSASRASTLMYTVSACAADAAPIANAIVESAVSPSSSGVPSGADTRTR
jgi:hypothetical protein